MNSPTRCFVLVSLTLSIGGCSQDSNSQFPEAFSRIQVGKPLDCSVLPSHVCLPVAGEHQLFLQEYRQLPLGYECWNLGMDFDPDWNVTSVRMDKSTFWYGILFLGSEAQHWERGPKGESSTPSSRHCAPIFSPEFWMYPEVPRYALGGAGIGFESQHPIDARKLQVGPAKNQEATTQP
jgi:hypothetical protein